ncbi:hypothetical protein Dester_0070 [Desulfurobacterium thermolithotrophum DSM 11699]|uniref:Uncharacterized protein n=1 Tax=Desulfurobacterium thermolithotrophum (strain DSM 11699 / BSA) TaxID=868864 RepID=F0S0K1_DESTD|nr:hypothetical protein [Desulfurobacterium thermolithotrophum]ADY72729.1 hypothetical protein Dester_0070 [Desulfurobacterium thermolithotrophum DSM 11699]
MSCSCRKGKSAKKLKTKEIDELLKFLKKNPELFFFIANLVNSFRPIDPERIKAERVFLTVREVHELGLLSFSQSEELFRLLKNFFVEKTDKQRGNFLELLVSILGPFTFKAKNKRINQCKMFKKYKKLSDKEIDVAFSSKEYLEVHECKSNMGRQWRDPLSKKSKKGAKLFFMNELPEVCKSKRKVIVCCSGLDGELTTCYVKKVFKFYKFKNIKVIGRKELLEKIKASF